MYVLCYDVSDIGNDGSGLFISFVKHWLDGFCVDAHEAKFIAQPSDQVMHLSITFTSEKDYLIAIIKDFPPNLSKFRVLR